MNFEWSDSLSVGDLKIDGQHMQLIDAVNELLDAMNAGKGQQAVDRTFKFLGEYVVTHFKTEEDMMKKCSYPDYPTHCQEHQKFVLAFKELQNDYQAKGTSSYLAIQVQRKVCDWLLKHIKHLDVKFGKFMKEHK